MGPIQADPAASGRDAGQGREASAIWGIVAFAAIASASPAKAAMLQIVVTGIHNDKGWIGVCIFDSPQGFPNCRGNSSVITLRKPASPGAMLFDVDVAPGVRAVSVLHDENGNGRLDTNFFGMPIEGGGASNNPPPRLGPPRFADAAFTVAPDGGRITIRMVYP